MIDLHVRQDKLLHLHKFLFFLNCKLLGSLPKIFLHISHALSNLWLFSIDFEVNSEVNLHTIYPLEEIHPLHLTHPSYLGSVGSHSAVPADQLLRHPVI